MNTLQLVQYGSLWGLIFGAVFCAATLVLGWINVEMLLNDYPPDTRAKFGPMSAQTRKQANLASLPLLVMLFTVVFTALIQLRQAVGELKSDKHTDRHDYDISSVELNRLDLVGLVHSDDTASPFYDPAWHGRIGWIS